MTGGMLAISANGTNAGTGILWASHQFTGDANQAVRPGILHAYDAQNVTNELWNSEQNSARTEAQDQPGPLIARRRRVQQPAGERDRGAAMARLG